MILNEPLEPIPCHDVRARVIPHWVLEGVENPMHVEVNADQVTLHIDQWSATVTLYELNGVILGECGEVFPVILL